MTRLMRGGNHVWGFLCILATVAFQGTVLHAAQPKVQVDDAYARRSADGRRWTIGTAAVELAFETTSGRFGLVGYENKLVTPAQQYVDPSRPAPPFALQSSTSSLGRYLVEPIWTKFLPGSAHADPAEAHLQLDVKRGDLIGFSVGPHGDYTGDETEWITTVEYLGGQRYTSSQDATLDQGPVWSYCVHRRGTGQLEPIDAVEMMAYAEEKVRIPSANSGWRAPGETPHVGATKMHPAPSVDAVRVWRAPRDGKVAISGPARHFKGGGDTDLRILRIREKPPGYVPPPQRQAAWRLEAAEARRVPVGGRPAVQLDFTLVHEQVRAHLHLLAYPHTPVLRQWLELENIGSAPLLLDSPSPLCLPLAADATTQLRHYWMIGGTSGPTQGLLQSRDVTPAYQQWIEGQMTDAFVPWTALERRDKSRDGSFVALEYLGGWRLQVERAGSGPLELRAAFPELQDKLLPAGGRLELPLVTLGVFCDDLDQMAVGLYDWQYEYLWDYTHDDWHALMPHAVPWWPDSQNLQENFAGRLGADLDAVDTMRDWGFELLWDDAGWSESPNIWTPSREGPDFARTLRYLDKTGMKWLLWFCGRPSRGVMDGKVGSWGNFQWRTDGVGGFDLATDRAFREQIQQFLKDHPRSSFHTCNGGGRYAHTFEIQRYTDVNYFSDADTGGPRGEQTNHEFAYLDTPDKWMDIITSFQRDGKYDADRGRMILSMVPMWYLHTPPSDFEQIRRIGEIYHFLLREGVAGRWSYVFHPVVRGDDPHAWFQRTSRDRTKACILLKHRAPGEVTVLPRGLLPKHAYTVGLDSTQATVTRTGEDLMTNGIQLANAGGGELVWLGLPNRPRGGLDRTAPQAPGRVLSRRETNLGRTGVGVYWSPGRDDQAVSYYEVRRGGEVLGKATTGTYYFDHARNWNPQARYGVRAVDAEGNASGWQNASPLPDEPLEAAALGGFFSEAGREGWRAETTSDDRHYEPMRWVAPARPSSGDTGGTAKQVGGAEGYWEGAGHARVGRGWQQAAAQAACIRSWVAPQSGTVRILGRAMKEYYHRNDGQPLRVRIVQGDTPVWPKQGWATIPVGDLTGLSHDVSLTVAQGDVLHFVLDKSAAPDSAILAWMPRIVYQGGDAASPTAGSVVRIHCGAQEPYTDHCGNIWSADCHFSGGHPVSAKVAIEGTLPTNADQPLYQAGRAGKQFTYAIPVASGLYSLRLKLAETQHDWSFQRPWDLEINGRRVLANFDTAQAARGARRAYERVFRYLVPDAQGKLVLRFTGGSDPLAVCDEALVQAIEVLPEQKSVIRIDAGSAEPFVDWNGFVWDKDTFCDDGQSLESTGAVAQASPTLYDQRLYHTARAGKTLRYRIPVSPGLYVVHLKFAELWLREPGKRPMTISVNGQPVRRQWDPLTAAGQPSMAADIRVEDITPTADGRIEIRLDAAGPSDAIVQGIEIE